MKIKVTRQDFFGHLDYVTINGVRLTSNNIHDYDFYKMPRKSNNLQTVYKIDKKDKIQIIHDLITNEIDWYECN